MTASDKKNYVILKKGDFSYNKSYSKAAPWGACKMLTLESGLISSAYFNFRFKKQAYNEYFQYYFESSTWHKNIFKIAQEGARNHGMLNMSKEDFFSIKMNNVSDDIRFETASILSQIDNLIYNQTNLIKMRNILLKKLLHLLKLSTNNPSILIMLSTITNIYQPETISKSEFLINGKFPVFGANGYIGYYSNYNHDTPQVSVSCRGENSGSINYISEYTWITGNSMVLNVLDENLIIKKYLYYILLTMNLKSYVSGSSQPQITGADLKRLKVPVPKRRMQLFWVNILSQMDNYIKTTSIWLLENHQMLDFFLLTLDFLKLFIKRESLITLDIYGKSREH